MLHSLRRLTPAAGAALLLAACGGEDQATVIEPGETNAPPAAATQADTLTWTFSTPSDGARLVFGEPATDNVRLMLRCGGADGAVTASYITSAVNPPADMVLLSGDNRQTLPAETTPTELGQNSVTVSAQIPIDAPVLRAFQQTGRLSLYRAGELAPADATGAERDAVARFFGACPGSGSGAA